ncbi:unnamed protein product [Rotaria sp. Silwood2]|nr:unnamed protein product [Rotaria sp. Silwood2]CAF2857954.1 unnamed protein product [Rotaria sp. Silwood2]CAF3146183.1 unnamed protein product [Rotaria sp. Silwood2]CAF3235075.1 unnamed protein product [Rotaria sp. Silwood2]CAF3993337.1 unnamed protein product [Rotaria sp. Silwood2]
MNSTTDDAFLHRLQSIPQTLYNTVGFILFIIGTFGNLLDIICFSRLKSLNTLSSSLFLLASFFGSELVLITGLLQRFIFGVTGNDLLFDSLFICKARSMLKPASATFSMTCVCFAAMDRYFFSCLDLRRQRRITLKQTRLIITIAVILCLIIFSPYAVFYSLTTPTSCSVVNSIFAYIQPCLSLIFYNLAPVIILSTICALTWRNLGQQVAFYLRGNNRYYDQVTRLIIGQIIVIVVTTFPVVIWLIYSIATKKISKNSVRLAQEAIINSACGIAAHCPYAMMFYVYLAISPVFRRNVKRLFLQTNQVLPLKNVELVRNSILQLKPRHTISTI